MAYQNYAGVWLTQSNGAYDWLANPDQAVALSPGIDTVKIWQSFSLPDTVNNLIVFGDHNYAAGNNQDNVIQSVAPGDLIYGGRGNDVFVGSGSGTTFIVAQGEGDKVIQNFTEGADTLRLIAGPLTSFAAVQSGMSQNGSDVILNDGGTMIAFRNANVGQFHASDFQLPMNYAALGPATFAEDFNSSGTIATNWATNYGYAGTGLNSFTLPGNGEQQIYTSSSFQGTSSAPLGLNPFSFNNGVLTISAQPVSDGQSAQMWGYHYSSGLLESNYAQTYGYFEMRAELPQGQGLWPAFWLLGPSNKEIDVLEGLGSDTKVANNAVHSPDVPAIGNASFNPYATGFHNYGVLWDPQHLTYYIDGTPVWQTATPADMNSPMHMIVNLAVGGNWPGSPNASTPFPAQMQIDYVHAYALPSADTGLTGPSSAGSAGKVLSSGYPGATLTGGTGPDTLIASQGSDRLTGGAGADTFSFHALPWTAGHVTDFQVGVDTLDISSLYARGYNGANPVADGYVSFVSDGVGGTKVLLDTDGPASGNTIKYVITDLDGVSPAGLTAAKVFGGSTATTAGSAAGSTGGSAGSAGQLLTSGYAGATVAGGPGADTLIASQGPDHLFGGAGADTFSFHALPWSAGHITDFQAGVDKLDLSALYAKPYSGSDPVADGYVSFVSDGAGGAKVLLDTDSWASGNTIKFVITDLDGVSPSGLTAANVLGGSTSGSTAGPTGGSSAGSAGQVLISSYPGAILVGGSGADTLIASQGGDQMTGGAGADHFVFNHLPWSAGQISDFTPGTDVLDLRALFTAAGYHGVDPIADGTLRLVSDGAGDTRVMFHDPSSPWPTLITTLDHVGPASLQTNDWLFK
ncbi:MAG: endo,3,4-beta-glycanase [Caulobacteraceae bacterium]|nr:endo,3,4-beta-glycanase [Caulobacteraceae bacterium]